MLARRCGLARCMRRLLLKWLLPTGQSLNTAGQNGTGCLKPEGQKQ